MKKLTVIICSLALVALAAAPVLAADVQFRGELRERMFSDNKVELNDDNASNVYHDQRWRLRTVYTVNKNLRLTTQFDVHDGKDWG
ncbi:MAG: hypothetical protein Q8P24_06885, partial [Desulfobacterales bacterium]|nr:hypothetical protein [Desulfobacterales bacterium]